AIEDIVRGRKIKSGKKLPHSKAFGKCPNSRALSFESAYLLYPFFPGHSRRVTWATSHHSFQEWEQIIS
ncbi:MAG: hypothetical protein LLF94_10595, partial [Chlamydiales bacterium]|nr:hypothetical protein [Chlamydiales bacterium]